MNNVVKYMCKQLDKRYSDQKFFCTKELGEDCIGISGYVLNYLLSGFLHHNRPIDAQNVSYRIKWVCENERLYPIVMRKDGQHDIQYIGTKAAEPGFLDYSTIGRQQCHKVAQEPLYLKLEETTANSLNQELLSLESDIHDHYTVRRPKTQQYRKVLLTLAREVRDSAQVCDICSAQNCLLMLFAPDETSNSLLQYLQRTPEQSECHVVLKFLADYCAFIKELLLFSQDNPISPEVFRRHFSKCWKINLGASLGNDIIQHDTSLGVANTIIPVTPFLSVSEFKELIGNCIHAASYKQRIRYIKQLRQALEERCDKGDAEVQEELSIISQYIDQMQALHDKARHVS